MTQDDQGRTVYQRSSSGDEMVHTWSSDSWESGSASIRYATNSGAPQTVSEWTLFDDQMRPSESIVFGDAGKQLRTVINRNEAGLPTSIVAPDSKISEFLYGNYMTGRPTQTRTGNGINTITRTYRTDGTLQSVTDATGETTQYLYDSFGRKSAELLPGTPAGSNTKTWTYDALGRLFQVDAANGSGVQYSYDALTGDLARIIHERDGFGHFDWFGVV